MEVLVLSSSLLPASTFNIEMKDHLAARIASKVAFSPSPYGMGLKEKAFSNLVLSNK
jgi:hypothetical protein